MFHSYEQERERQEDAAQDAMTQGEYMREALYQYAAAYGGHSPDVPWILSPFDTWERNPHYQGEPARHPWDDQDEPEAARQGCAQDAQDEAPVTEFTRDQVVYGAGFGSVGADEGDDIPF